MKKILGFLFQSINSAYVLRERSWKENNVKELKPLSFVWMLKLSIEKKGREGKRGENLTFDLLKVFA